MYKVSQEVLNATLQYLSNRPYAEVVQLIQALGSSEEIKKELKEEDSGE